MKTGINLLNEKSGLIQIQNEFKCFGKSTLSKPELENYRSCRFLLSKAN
jgi:hypothetical protein